MRTILLILCLRAEPGYDFIAHGAVLAGSQGPGLAVGGNRNDGGSARRVETVGPSGPVFLLRRLQENKLIDRFAGNSLVASTAADSFGT